MNADDIIKELRDSCTDDEYAPPMVTNYILSAAANLIESLQAELAESQRRAKDARNELCLKCGRYREAHTGACDGCRWKEPRNES